MWLALWFAAALGAQTAGERADLARFGKPLPPAGVEWDEPREFGEIQAAFAGPLDPARVHAEYWVSSWPPLEGRGGWTLTDSPWVGGWRPIRSQKAIERGVLVIRFDPLSKDENPNAERQPDFRPRFRRALKVRLRIEGQAPAVKSFEVYGSSRWNRRAIRIETGLEGKPACVPGLSAYNGAVREATRPLFDVWYLEHAPESPDSTVLTVRCGEHAFGLSLDDVMRAKSVYFRDLGIFAGDGETFEEYRASGRMRPGRDILSLAWRREQTLENATAEIPPLTMTGRTPHRYVPVGFFGNREKYALLFDGNFFLHKKWSKLFAEEVARMLWQGDYLRFRIGTGAVPDFREREGAARQRMLDDVLPVVQTEWEQDDILYREEAFATLVDAALDPWKNRGDERSMLLVRVTAVNRGMDFRTARVWLHVDPGDALEMRQGALFDSGGRFRAAIDGDSSLEELPAESAYRGRAALWRTGLAPGASGSVTYRVGFFTLTDPRDVERLSRVDYDRARREVVEYWRGIDRLGMRLHVPDEAFNRFFRASLQHTLLSVFRDVPTGLYMAPCGTLRYNMFANETNMLVRLLDMRGLHNLAARFVEPFARLQGSKPFPGRFRSTDAIFHGVRVDADHDYTHSGYNLNHGWTLWTLAEHWLFTRDRKWLAENAGPMRKAAEWIVSERQSTMTLDASGQRAWEYGLLPAGQLEDNEELLYWFAVNGYAYKGLRAAAEALGEIDPAFGRKLTEEAAKYRTDIRAAALRSMASVPAVPLRDGTWIPSIGPRTALHARDVGWIRNILYGAHALVDTGVIDPDERIATWILQDLEDNLFMSAMSFSVPDQDWFSRGGITLQPNLVNTCLTYLRRDQIPQFLRPFYNTFAASWYPDVNAFTEWLPSFGKSDGPFYKTSDEAGFLAWLRLMLVREEGSKLLLASGAPRHWFRTGERIVVERAATFFGPLDLRIESHASDGRLEAEVVLPERIRGRDVMLRLRHPEGKPMRRVEIDGASAEFDPGRELVTVPAIPGSRRIRAEF